MSIDNISRDLTFEEFKAYADRQPSLDGDWIYRLEHIGMIENTAMYPEFETRSNEYYFHTFGDAEKFIREKLTGSNAVPDSYCFIITQLAVGCMNCWNNTGASWLYDHEGKLIDYNITTWEEDPYKSAFFGRSAERLRFKKGDIVEVINQDSVNLAVVAADGPSVNWYWGLYNRSKDKRGGYFTDASDDCYYLLDGPGFVYHSHTPAVALMRPSFPIPEDIKAFFEHCLEVSGKEECTDKYRCFDCRPDDIKELSMSEIMIRFDEKAQRHILVKEVSDYVSRHSTDYPIHADESELIDRLKEVRYGKSRLWYIIRDWNENIRDLDEPELPLDTPVNELIK